MTLNPVFSLTRATVGVHLGLDDNLHLSNTSNAPFKHWHANQLTLFARRKWQLPGFETGTDVKRDGDCSGTRCAKNVENLRHLEHAAGQKVLCLCRATRSSFTIFVLAYQSDIIHGTL